MPDRPQYRWTIYYFDDTSEVIVARLCREARTDTNAMYQFLEDANSYDRPKVVINASTIKRIEQEEVPS